MNEYEKILLFKSISFFIITQPVIISYRRLPRIDGIVFFDH